MTFDPSLAAGGQKIHYCHRGHWYYVRYCGRDSLDHPIIQYGEKVFPVIDLNMLAFPPAAPEEKKMVKMYVQLYWRDDGTLGSTAPHRSSAGADHALELTNKLFPCISEGEPQVVYVEEKKL